MRSTGLRKASAEVADRIARGEVVAPSEYYFRTHIRLSTSAPRLAWMNDILAVSTGERRRDTVRIDVARGRLSVCRASARSIVVGAGIGGLVAALSLHEIGARVDVYESVREVRPLGVGINLLPHAVRELDALGLARAAAPSVDRAAEPSCTARVTARRSGGSPRRRRRLPVAAAVDPPRHAPGDPARRVRRPGGRATTSTSVTDWFGSTPTTNHAQRGASPRRRATGDAIVSGGRGDRGRRHPQRRPRAALPRRGPAPVERLAPVARDRRDRTGARRPHDGLGRASRPEVRRLPDRRPARRPAGVQLHRRAAAPGRPALGEREDWNRAGELADFLPEFEDWGFDWLDVPAIIRSAPAHVRVPDGRPRPGDALDVRSLDPARRRRPPDVPDRFQRRIAGDPRRARPRRMPACRRRRRRRARALRGRRDCPRPRRSWKPTAGSGRRCRCSSCTSARPTASTTSTR